jgi:hypothetical protein
MGESIWRKSLTVIGIFEDIDRGSKNYFWHR